MKNFLKFDNIYEYIKIFLVDEAKSFACAILSHPAAHCRLPYGKSYDDVENIFSSSKSPKQQERKLLTRGKLSSKLRVKSS